MNRRIAPMIVLLAGLVPGMAHAETNIDQGKSPAQIFAIDCAVCHKSVRGLAGGRDSVALAGFLREHYTTSAAQAAALAAYVVHVGGRGKPAVEHAREAGRRIQAGRDDKAATAKQRRAERQAKREARREAKPARAAAGSKPGTQPGAVASGRSAKTRQHRRSAARNHRNEAGVASNTAAAAESPATPRETPPVPPASIPQEPAAASAHEHEASVGREPGLPRQKPASAAAKRAALGRQRDSGEHRPEEQSPAEHKTAEHGRAEHGGAAAKAEPAPVESENRERATADARPASTEHGQASVPAAPAAPVRNGSGRAVPVQRDDIPD